MRNRLITALFVASAAILLAGCKSTHTIEQVPVEVAKVVKDTVHVTNVERDSIYLHDSVEVRGDTVTRWHTAYRYKLRHDTVYKARVDTIEKPVYITKTVTKEVHTKHTDWRWGIGVAIFALIFGLMVRRKE